MLDTPAVYIDILASSKTTLEKTDSAKILEIWQYELETLLKMKA